MVNCPDCGTTTVRMEAREDPSLGWRVGCGNGHEFVPQKGAWIEVDTSPQTLTQTQYVQRPTYIVEEPILMVDGDYY